MKKALLLVSTLTKRRYGDIAIFLIFKMTAAAILNFQKIEILTVYPLYGANKRHRAKFHQDRSKVAEIWRFNGFQNGGRPHSWICEIRIF